MFFEKAAGWFVAVPFGVPLQNLQEGLIFKFNIRKKSVEVIVRVFLTPQLSGKNLS